MNGNVSIDQEKLSSVSHKTNREGKGKAFGTFGELLQGYLGELNSNFLVTLPIANYSYASFTADPDGTVITTTPSYKQKSQMLASMILQYYGLPCGGKLVIESDLPVGKGLASSSADLVATARAISSCFGITLPVTVLQTLMHKIEPSDGVMYPGVVSFHHQQVRLREFLGPLPAITIVSIDEGGELDTILFNQRPKPFVYEDAQEYQHLLDVISAAVRKQDLKTIGQIATRSAQLNQKLNLKQTLDDLIAICEDVEGLGVAVAHSGTCLGLLLSPQDQRYRKQLQAAYKHLSSLAETIAVYHSLKFD